MTTSNSPSPAVWVGCSGYEYGHWRGVFYPSELPRTRWFGYYASHFDTVEINNTFYGLPRPEAFDAWRERAPAGFCYVLKLSRYGTHQKKLKDPEGWLNRFLSRAERLGPTLGPILVQLPPAWRADPGRLDAFLAVAPDRHRWAVEFRDHRWLCQPVYEVLARHKAALCIHDLIEDHPRLATTNWVYLRLHGPQPGRGSVGLYSPQALSGAARWIRRQLDERNEVFAYFNNDVEGYAVRNALTLKRYLDLR